MYVLHVEQMLTKTKPKDVQEIKGCSGNRGMFKKSRDVQEIEGCSGNQGMFRKSRDVQEIKGYSGNQGESDTLYILNGRDCVFF